MVQPLYLLSIDSTLLDLEGCSVAVSSTIAAQQDSNVQPYLCTSSTHHGVWTLRRLLVVDRETLVVDQSSGAVLRKKRTRSRMASWVLQDGLEMLQMRGSPTRDESLSYSSIRAVPQSEERSAHPG